MNVEIWAEELFLGKAYQSAPEAFIGERHSPDGKIQRRFFSTIGKAMAWVQASA